MDIVSTLFNKYIFRQTFITLISIFIISMIITFVSFFVGDGISFTSPKFENIFKIIIMFLVWILFIFSVTKFVIFYLSFKKDRDNLDPNSFKVYERITNDIVRENASHYGVKIGIFWPRKKDNQAFKIALKDEIIKQRKLLNIIEDINDSK